MNASHPVVLDTLYGDYPLDRAFDEMREPDGEVRPHYRALAETLARLPEEELQRRKQSADLSFLTQGITFTVYGRDEGTERIFPYDLLPRLITAAEWDRIERGLTQRITALNLFLRDVYSDAKILNDKIIPSELVYSCKHYRRQMRGLQVPRNVYIAVVGSDLLRLEQRGVCGSGGQSPRSLRRELYAHQPSSDEADISRVVFKLRRTAH